MSATSVALAHPSLLGYQIGEVYWIFAAPDFKASTFLLLKREGFSGNFGWGSDSTELDDLLTWLEMDQIKDLFRLAGEEPSDRWFDSWVKSDLRDRILGAGLKVYKVNEKTARRLANGSDPIYSSSSPYGTSTGNPVDQIRNQLALTLGQEIEQRWDKKDLGDQVHWESPEWLREMVEVIDSGSEVADVVVNFAVGLFDAAAFLIKLAGDAIELTIQVHAAAFNAYEKLIKGDVEGIRRDLEALGIELKEALESAQAFEQKLQQGYDTFCLLKNDPLSCELILDYFSSLYESIPYRDSRNIGINIVAQVGLEVLLALATGGAGTIAKNAARAGANVAGKAAKAARAARIGPFSMKAIDQMVDLARALRKSEIKEVEAPPIRIVDENAGPRKTGSGGDNDSGNGGSNGGNNDSEPTPDPADTNGADKPAAKNTCTNGCPISMVNGEELLELVDFHMDGPIPFVWQRVYRTSGIETNSGLGYGWTSPLSQRLVFNKDDIKYMDDEGRAVNFNHIGIGQQCRNRSEKLTLNRIGQNHYAIGASSGLGIRYHFEPSDDKSVFWMTHWSDQSGHKIFFHRQNGLVNCIRTTEGEELQLAHDQYGHIVAIDRVMRPEDRPEYIYRQVAYEYSDEADLIASYDELGHAQRYRYDQHVIQQRTLKSGFNFYFEWTHLGTDARCLRNWGDQINGEHVYDYKFEWELENNTSHATDSRGGRLSYRFNHMGLPVWIRQPEGDETFYEYDRDGNLIKLTDAAGNSEQFQYDHNGHLIRHTNKLGHSQKFKVNHAGQVLEATDPTGSVWKRQYDRNGRLTQAIDPLGNSTRLDYNTAGLLAGITSAEGHKTSYIWDNHHRVTAVRNPLGSHTRYSYNERGQLTRVRYPNEQYQAFEYNDAGQCIAVRSSDGSSASYQYSPLGHLAQITDHTGRSTQYQYDQLSQVVKRIDASGQAFDYHYDAERNLVGLTNENGEQYQLKYDGNERLIEEIGFDGRVQRYQYSAAGHLASSEEYRTDNGLVRPFNRIRYRRDAAGKLLSQLQELDQGQPVHQYLANYRYDPAGRLLQANNQHRELSWQYNPAGQVIKALQDQHELLHSHNTLGQRISTQLPTGDQIHYGYNSAGQTEAIHWNDRLISGFIHDESGGEQARLFGNGLSQQNSFDPQGRLQAQTLRNHRNDQNTVINERKYQYNATGQISQIDDQLRGSTQYRYDNIERLIQVTGPQPEQFVHDPAGNLLGSPEDVDTVAAGSDTKTPQVSGNRLNFQGDRHYRYDAQGNRVEQRRGKDGKRVTRYQYDHQNRLIAIEQENSATQNGKGFARTEYQYDALGRRIRKIQKDANQQTTGGTEFYWNDDVLLTEQALELALESSDHPEQQQPTRHYVFEPNSFKPLAFVQHEQLHYYHLDHLGTPQEITNANGELVWTAQYKAYGSLALAPIRQVENNLRFQGQYFDEESGLHYNRFRYYDPECGRFINQDPIGLLGGNNNYLYVPNPVGWVDPWGLVCKEELKRRIEASRKAREASNFSSHVDAESSLALESINSKPDFYVGPTGPESTLPSTAYRYDRYLNDDGTEYKWGKALIETSQGRVTYFGFGKYETGAQARSAFQIKGPDIGPDDNGVGSWSDARVRGEFDTLQLYENGVPRIRVPRMYGDESGAPLEPFTEAYPQYGAGGVQQLHADRREVNFDRVDILPEGE
ncbi:RHS repeat-associated core domain-containing protein [Oceanobacter mangrovi]|uniref:RHS repeat-associated core domain-containing protein n=1 Tax=Oceanobacter mangrovi TaxID=2862510 RepID=UPI001C8DBD1A|nr:RHS repeat-associated core domain-containing protein [Oceanobacter mangrovi]